MQFFEEQFATVNFWRVAGADIAVRRQRWRVVRIPRWRRSMAGAVAKQRGRWDGVREMQIAQAIRDLEIIEQEPRDRRASDWQALSQRPTSNGATASMCPSPSPATAWTARSPLMLVYCWSAARCCVGPT